MSAVTAPATAQAAPRSAAEVASRRAGRSRVGSVGLGLLAWIVGLLVFPFIGIIVF